MDTIDRGDGRGTDDDTGGGPDGRPGGYVRAVIGATAPAVVGAGVGLAGLAGSLYGDGEDRQDGSEREDPSAGSESVGFGAGGFGGGGFGAPSTDGQPDDAFEPGSVVAEYDENDDGRIDMDELGAAALDYFEGDLTSAEFERITEAFAESVSS